MGRNRSLEDQLFNVGAILLLGGGLLLWVYYKIILPTGVIAPCILNRYTGYYCPGCGGTRAFAALIQGHFLQSLWYHPLVLYTAVIFGSFMLSHAVARITKNRFIKGLRFHNWYLYGAAIIVAVNFLAKNVLKAIWNISL